MGNILIGFLGRKAEFAAELARSSALPGIGARPLEVNVVFTSREATVAAMRQAAQLASDLGARVRVLAPQVVSFATDLEHPPVNTEFLARRYREIAAEAGVEASVQIVLCRDIADALRLILRPNSLVVVGGAQHWLARWGWPTRERKLARVIEAAGHQVLFVTKESTTCSTCSTY
jgi:hypothetical protein